MPCTRGFLFAALWAVVCGVLLPCSAYIVNYTVDSVATVDGLALHDGHWSKYRSICGSAAATVPYTSLASTVSQFPAITSSSLRAPFYALNATQWYVSGNGFLALTPQGMCSGYCEDNSFDALMGNYGFSANTTEIYGGGGDWPMISLFGTVFYLNNTNGLGSIEVMNAVGDKDASASLAETTHVVVEYCDVPVGTLPSSATLRAQVVVYGNGTIIMRYSSVPLLASGDSTRRSTGLIFTKQFRTIVDTPDHENDIVAYRFNPVVDSCQSGGASKAACLAYNGGDACAWCGSTSECVGESYVESLCPRGQWTTSNTSATTSQTFYDVQLDYSGSIASSLFTSYLDLGERDYVSLYSTTLSFSLFSDAVQSSSIYIQIGSTVSLGYLGSQCNPISNTCPNGNYTLAMLPFQTSLTWLDDSSTLRWANLGYRFAGDTLCSESNGCPQAVVLYFSGISAFTESTARYNFQLYIDTNGVVDMVLVDALAESGGALVTYPPLMVGLSRYTVDDASSAMVPVPLLRNNVHLRFVPSTSCVDCGLHGTCDETTGSCVCDDGFTGSKCNSCVTGRYGADCAGQCATCLNGGSCLSGISGSGTCSCPTPFGGRRCEVRCRDASSVYCSDCSKTGGYCECGTCVCLDGWSGPLCDVPTPDKCRSYSFDGCPVCGQQKGCLYCFDYTCYNPELSGTSSGYTCSYGTPAANTEACHFIDSSSHRLRTDYGVVSLACLIAAVVVFALLLALFTFCICKRRAVTNYAAAIAEGGAPDFRSTRREREVMPVNFARRRFPNMPVIAIPLKQISLRQIVRRRRLEQEEADAAVE